MTARDRRAADPGLDARFNGIDFVEVATTTQTALRVHFLNAVPVQGTLTGTPTITGGETIPTVRGAADRRRRLGLGRRPRRAHAAGRRAGRLLDLHADHRRARVLDPFFDHVAFSFKARCPSDLDCADAADASARRPTATRRRSTTSPRTSSASARRCSTSRRCATRTGRSAPRPTSA